MTAFVLRILGWLSGSETGRRAAAALLICAAIAVALWRARSAGYAARAAEEKEAALRGAAERIVSDEDVRRMDDRARADALARWVR